MSGVAAMLIRRGATITGSDQIESRALQELSSTGATIYIGHDYQNLTRGVDLVVASAAISEDNPEMLAARGQGLDILKYADLLGGLMRSTTGVAVAGTHGKSTTTAWAAFVAREVALDPSFIVGATVPQLGGGAGVGGGQAFIVEACEYDRSFLSLAPKHAAILNIEEDHLDYFRDIDEIVSAFSEFARLVPQDGMILYNHDDPAAQRAASAAGGNMESFGVGPGASWRAIEITLENGLPGFEIQKAGRSVGRTTLALPGLHNVSNALAACALVHRLGGNLDDILPALGRFEGVERRLTYRGRFRDIDILDDYAHHPTEITASLNAVRERYQPNRLIVVFQPHQVSRTRFFLADFAESFQQADEIIVPDIYFVRDSEADRQLVSSNDLVARIGQRGGKAKYVPELDQIADHLAEQVKPGDLVMTMGAGDVWKVADEMVLRLGADR